MTPEKFLETRSPAWDRLEMLIERTGRRGVAALSEAELHELTRLYPAVAVDVARARRYKIDPRTQRRINTLAIAAHGLLYRRRRVPLLPAVWKFLSHDYPRLFRRLWAYVALAAAMFLITGLGAYVSVQMRPSRVHLFFRGPIEMPDGKAGMSAEDISERFRQMPNAPMAMGITTNNISVAFNAFALGISAGVGTCYVIMMNGMMLGAFAAYAAVHGVGYPLLCFLVPHGALEIFAILVAAGAGLRLGMSLALPGKLSRGASLRVGARDAVLLVLGTIPMFVVAGAVEGFITPSYFPGSAKIALGLLLLLAALAWLLLAAHGFRAVRGPREPSSASQPAR